MQRLVTLLALLISGALAATVPSGFTDIPVASGLSSPTAMAFAPDGRLFVLLQGGSVRVIKNGTLLPSPFTTVPTSANGERGLLGIAFDPNFPVNQFVYLYYTVSTGNIHNRVSRFTASGDIAVAGSELPLLDLNDLTTATNHNGGAMHFGPDGKLYIAVGENASGTNSQSQSNLLGKILRMNSDGTIPADNPFFATNTGNNRLIWALGLRNPYTFGFQPGTGRLFINDVGQNTWEEVNDGIAGSNYGWPTTEGFFTQASFPNFRNPLLTYAHSGNQPSGCAITGGTFYNPSTVDFPTTYLGKYFFADFCSSWIYYFDPAGPTPFTATQFLTGASSPVDLKVGPDGKLYYLQRGGNGGEVRRVESTTSPLPNITKQPTAVTVAAGISATFTVEASGANLTYQWQRNTVNIPNATLASYTLTNPQTTDSGALFRVIVTNPNGSATSNAALLTITANQPPTATIATPAAGSLFSGGDTIVFNGSGNDPETGALPAANLKWRVDYITGAATRPFVGEFTGTGGSFLVPTITPYLLTDVYFLIVLTARDPQGFETTVTRRVDPRISRVSLLSNPAGLQLTADGQPLTSPVVFNSVVGLIRPIGVTSPQGNANTQYIFNNWSDAGAATHNITVPVSDSTYTASFLTQFRLTTATSPASGGTITTGGFQNANSSPAISVSTNPGWTFTGFSGDLTGTSNPQSLLMNAPKSVVASFAPLPALLTSQVVARVNGSALNERLWTLNIRNNGTGPAINARIASIQINIAGGPGPVSLLTALPVNLGTIAPGATVSPTLNLSFPATAPPTRVSVTLTIAGDFGLSTTMTLNNLFR